MKLDRNKRKPHGPPGTTLANSGSETSAVFLEKPDSHII